MFTPESFYARSHAKLTAEDIQQIYIYLCSAYSQSSLERSAFASLYSHCLMFATQMRLFKDQCQSESAGCAESKIIAIQIGNTFQSMLKETILYYNYVEFLSTVCQNL